LYRKRRKRLPAGKTFSDGWTPFPYLRVTDMRKGTIDTSSLVYVSEEIEKTISNYKISKNDIYVTIAGTLGLFGTIPDNLDKSQLTENLLNLLKLI
jgi:type I restriction enzyme S subunit